MPLETLTGQKISLLLSKAQQKVGADAVVLSLKQNGAAPGGLYELVVADPETAREWRRALGSQRATGGDSTMIPRPLAEGSPRGDHPFVIALVGPTGAGKTTTIAKLANHPEVFAGRALGLVCLDTYRVGAVEQARIYAELSRAPLEIVYEAKEIGRAMRRLKDCHVLLVDTAGRGPGGDGDVEATRMHLQRLKPDEVHLTLPAGLNPRFARRILSDHLRYGVTHILPTKVDEFPEDETAFHLAAEHRLGTRWVTNGQAVPGNLLSARAWTLRSPAEESSKERRRLVEVT
jgi:flagellar biosynthesis protein FlhF